MFVKGKRPAVFFMLVEMTRLLVKDNCANQQSEFDLNIAKYLTNIQLSK